MLVLVDLYINKIGNSPICNITMITHVLRTPSQHLHVYSCKIRSKLILRITYNNVESLQVTSMG